jgi:hypothetical protein
MQDYVDKHSRTYIILIANFLEKESSNSQPSWDGSLRSHDTVVHSLTKWFLAASDFQWVDLVDLVQHTIRNFDLS